MIKSLPKIIFLIVFIFMLIPLSVFCDEDKNNPDHTPESYSKAEFPLWQREMRRFEILTLGALPFVTMLSFWTYDISRSIKYSGDPRYYPWPIKKADIAVPLTQDEQIKIFGTAVGISVGIALFDICYRAIKRDIEMKKLERENVIENEEIKLIPITPDKNNFKTEEDILIPDNHESRE